MMSMKSLVLCFGIVALSLQSAHCFDENDAQKFKELFEPIFAECGPKFGVTKEQLHALRENKDLSSISSCFTACVYKSAGFLDDKGMYDKDAAIAEAKKHLSGDTLTTAEEIAEKCVSVNDASVSDEDAGCERAKLLFECYKNKGMMKN